MRNFLADYNLLAVSANAKETALNTEQTLDTSLLVAKNTIIGLERRREDNRNELTGKEEADTVYDLGTLSAASLVFDKAQAQHFGFGYAFALGVDIPAAWGGGYKHAITPTASMDLPSFTATMRIGQTIFKRRFGGMHVDSLSAIFERDSWAKLTLGIKGTGKYTDNMYCEEITAAYNAASLTLAANAVEGADAATRLDNVHAIRVLVPATGEYKDVAFSVVSAATPAVITITPPGGVVTSTTYEVLYVPDEPAWCSFPARVAEPPLRVTDLAVKIGGKWNGSSFLEGHTIGAEIDSIEHTFNNQLAIEYRVGGTGDYANFALRNGRMQSIRLNRQARDFIMQQKMIDNEYLGVYMKATGDEFETGKNYYVEVIFPKCNVLKADLSVNGKILAEAGDIVVLQDDTYSSVLVNVANEVAAYAA